MATPAPITRAVDPGRTWIRAGPASSTRVHCADLAGLAGSLWGWAY
jgi:hypothetical protein